MPRILHTTEPTNTPLKRISTAFEKKSKTFWKEPKLRLVQATYSLRSQDFLPTCAYRMSALAKPLDPPWEVQAAMFGNTPTLNPLLLTDHSNSIFHSTINYRSNELTSAIVALYANTLQLEQKANKLGMFAVLHKITRTVPLNPHFISAPNPVQPPTSS
eukprot:14028894-Ditylum_brightwellii.AAC.1